LEKYYKSEREILHWLADNANIDNDGDFVFTNDSSPQCFISAKTVREIAKTVADDSLFGGQGTPRAWIE